LLVQCGCDAGDCDSEGAGAFIGGRFGDPDFFCLGGLRCGGECEFEAVEAFFGEGWGLEGFFDQIAELILDVNRRGEFG
jgi:hypothetical protein